MKKTTPDEVHQRLRTIREEKKISQESAADAIGVSVHAFLNFENGKTKLFPKMFCKVAKLYEYSELELMEKIHGFKDGILCSLDMESLIEERVSAVRNEYEARLEKKQAFINEQADTISNQAMENNKLKAEINSLKEEKSRFLSGFGVKAICDNYEK